MTSEKRLRITFCVNTLGLTGGIKVVLEYANRLIERGHTVTIVHALNLEPRDLPSKAGWKRLAKQVKYALTSAPVKWFPLKAQVLRVPRLTDQYLPDADIVIATANETADFVARLAPAKGVKAYFIQHLEKWTRDSALVEATWKLPLHKITIASWLAEHARGLGQKVEATITNGVDTQFFVPRDPDRLGETSRLHQPIRILLMGHPLPWKGTKDAYQALATLRANHPELNFQLTEFSAYSQSRLPHWQEPAFQAVQEHTTFQGEVVGEALRSLYQDHDIFISPSHAEGCQLPPMEAMACGCAVVATNVGGIPDYAIAGKTALVVEPGKPADLAAALTTLLQNPDQIAALQKAGHAHIQQFTWKAAVNQFESVLLRLTKEAHG